MNDLDVSEAEFHELRQSYMATCAGLISIAFVVSLLYLLYMRTYISRMAIELDEGAHTPSDFCVMGMEMYFDDYSAEAMEAKITEVFKRKYGVDVEYVNPCFKLSNFY
jgi:hypothetical protein